MTKGIDNKHNMSKNRRDLMKKMMNRIKKKKDMEMKTKKGKIKIMEEGREVEVVIEVVVEAEEVEECLEEDIMTRRIKQQRNNKDTSHNEL